MAAFGVLDDRGTTVGLSRSTLLVNDKGAGSTTTDRATASSLCRNLSKAAAGSSILSASTAARAGATNAAFERAAQSCSARGLRVWQTRRPCGQPDRALRAL